MTQKYYFLFIFLGCLFSCSDDNKNLNKITVTISDFTKTINENPQENEPLGTINAYTNQGSLTYSIVNQSPNDALVINSSTGDLKVLKKNLFDFETNPSITATIKVQNGEIFKTANITINLNNIIESRILKKITETNLNYVIEIFILSNEVTQFCETLSGNSFSSFNYGNQWYAYHQQVNGNAISYSHDPQKKNEYTTKLPTINLGGNNFAYFGNSNNTYESADEGKVLYNGDIFISYNAVLSISTISISDILEKEVAKFNAILYRKLILNKTLNDGKPLPSNLWISLNTGSGSVYENNKEVLRVESTWWAKFNGTTWEEQNTDIFGNKVQISPNFCN
jgi:hypothetical protein